MLILNTKEKKIVKKIIEDLMKQNGLFAGNYDAENGNLEFMYGISSLLEYLAYSVDENFGNDVEDVFVKNILKSEKKPLTNI
jgi:hypothetical protein